MKIIDAHHHIWRQADLPWLLGPSQPRIFGEYDEIKRDYSIEEFLDDIGGSGVETSAYVQASWAPNGAADEVAWVQETADRTGWPHAIVGYCDMTVPDARPALDKLAKYPLMRGIRQQLHWHENPQYRFAAHAEMCRDETLQRNIGHLADYGWSFDLQVFAGQMDGACEVADACPNVIKEVLFRAADRTAITVTLVANQPLRTPPSKYIRSLQVAAGFDVADNEIVRRCEAGDLVITADIPLAARARMTGRYSGRAPAMTAFTATFSTVNSQYSRPDVGRSRPTTSSGA